MPEHEIDLAEILNETDQNKKFNALIAIAYDNRTMLKDCKDTIANLPCQTEECLVGYSKKHMAINWSGIAAAIGIGIGSFIYTIFHGNH